MINRRVTEAELRVYGFCAKLYELNAILEYKNEMQIACKQMIERFLLYQLKNGSKTFYDEIIPVLVKESINSAYSKIGHEDVDGLKEIANKRLNAWFNDYINMFKPHQYEVILGPYLPTVNVSNTLIELDIVGILINIRTRKIHILTWMNDVKLIEPLWDLASIAKFEFASNYTKKDVIIHFLDINHRNTYSKEICMQIKSIDEKELDLTHKVFLKEKIKEFEKQSDYHRIPYCVFMDCPKRRECQK